jgi:hypothetical protein
MGRLRLFFKQPSRAPLPLSLEYVKLPLPISSLVHHVLSPTIIFDTLEMGLSRSVVRFLLTAFAESFPSWFFHLLLKMMFYFHLLPIFAVFLIAFFLYFDRCSLRICLLFLERYKSSLMCPFDPQRICFPIRRSWISHGLGIWSKIYFIRNNIIFSKQ